MSGATPLYILDSDAVSNHQRGHPAVVAHFASTDSESIAITIVTVEEQLQGRLARVRRQTELAELVATHQRLRATQAYFCALPILPFDERAAAQYRELQCHEQSA